MNGATKTWAIAIAVAALLTGPVVVRAQDPPATAADARETETGQRRLAHEHLHKASAAIGQIAIDQQPADVKTQLADIERRITALREDADMSAPEPAEMAKPATQPADADEVDREAELEAIERTLTALLGDEEPAATTRPDDTAVGTSGTRPHLDEATRTHLEQARTHIAAYTAAIGSAESAAEAADQSDRVESSRGTPASAPSGADATAVTSPTDPTPSPTGTSPTDMPQTPAAPESTAALGGAPPSPWGSEVARRHLLAARNTLSELTQMPQAATITGEARAEVSQLISRFNHLIAAGADWREPLGDVRARLDTLLAPGDPDAAPPDAQPVEPVGTTGRVTLDPQVRAKLVEFRTHLDAFERSANGAPVPSGPAEPSPGTAAPRDVAIRASETDPTTASGSTSTGAPVAQMPGPAAGTVGVEPALTGNGTGREALRHIDAIEAILGPAHDAAESVREASGVDAADRPTDDTRTAAIEPVQVDEIRRHLNELRRLIERGGP